MSRDLICGVVMLVLAVAYTLAAAAIPVSRLADSVGPGGLPQAYGLVLGGLSVLLIARTLLAGRNAAVDGAPRPSEAVEEPDDAGPEDGGRAFLPALVMLAIGAVYLAVVSWVGYPVAIALLVGATIVFRGGRRPAAVAAVAVGAGAVLWLVFVYILQIPQPMGVFTGLGG
ncbi:tripartite tricarboxylate transporter TctB family protein [Mangrovibrevibacter kandeliae]|uniref:tripartite tricarboxylate transporter TctB family protein n=1 Tax=Mangrovibrevibacter kandeliae TaxID=2968473 RepID=UPI00211852AD|nr:tripartite tricarboxylate transporter TctB family protein [Aurantimonas sp. CSK15Z-1]MCQ8781209.1 tripartite tricarboxylate transporter TctB family protein [Aurantimonas sp. CSK15Z-1]